MEALGDSDLPHTDLMGTVVVRVIGRLDLAPVTYDFATTDCYRGERVNSVTPETLSPSVCVCVCVRVRVC